MKIIISRGTKNGDVGKRFLVYLKVHIRSYKDSYKMFKERNRTDFYHIQHDNIYNFREEKTEDFLVIHLAFCLEMSPAKR